jgi:hypothetical protein
MGITAIGQQQRREKITRMLRSGVMREGWSLGSNPSLLRELKT